MASWVVEVCEYESSGALSTWRPWYIPPAILEAPDHSNMRRALKMCGKRIGRKMSVRFLTQTRSSLNEEQPMRGAVSQLVSYRKGNNEGVFPSQPRFSADYLEEWSVSISVVLLSVILPSKRVDSNAK